MRHFRLSSALERRKLHFITSEMRSIRSRWWEARYGERRLRRSGKWPERIGRGGWSIPELKDHMGSGHLYLARNLEGLWWIKEIRKDGSANIIPEDTSDVRGYWVPLNHLTYKQGEMS